mmetsp:Transcript_73870/g.138028  ORF Transcript_73870/g.138028 Transcript_73870/m.138028 type:complete len:787 (-) Transcript_73870:275-2635(-)
MPALADGGVDPNAFQQQCFLLQESLQAQLALAEIYLKLTVAPSSEAQSLLADSAKRVPKALQALLPRMKEVHEEVDDAEDEIVTDVDALEPTKLALLTSANPPEAPLSEGHGVTALAGVSKPRPETLGEEVLGAEDGLLHVRNGMRTQTTKSHRGATTLQLERELAGEKPMLWPVWAENEAPRLMKVSATEILQDAEGEASQQPSWALDGLDLRKSSTGMRRSDSRYGDRSVDQLSCLIIPPSALITLLVDFVSLIMITWDLTTLPLIAFDLQKSSTVRALNLVTTIYWAAELPLPFFLGYYRRTGKMELRFRKIAHRYLKSWFFPQLFLVLADLASVFLDVDTGEAVSIFRSSRIFRVLKIARLARILKLSNVIERLEGFTSLVISEMLQAVMSLTCLSIMTGMACHTLACLWYAIGTHWNDGTARSIATETDIEDFSGVFQYQLCFQWVWAQFTPAPPPRGIEPFNEREASFAIALRVAGLVLFSSFVGSVTAMIAQARKLMETRWKENMQMRLYFKDNSVKISLSMTIMSFLMRKRAKRTVLLEHEVTLLKNLPYTMLAELRLQVWGPVIAAHPLFMYLAQYHTPTLKQLCASGISEKRAEAGEELLHYGRIADVMYFVREREESKPQEAVHYFAGVHVKGRQPTGVVLEGGWFGEVALWLGAHSKESHAPHPWRHHGHAVAVRECALVEIHASRLREIVLEHPIALKTMQHYAGEFITALPIQLESVNIVGSDGEADFLIKRCVSAGNLPEATSSSWSLFGSGFSSRDMPTSPRGQRWNPLF